MRSCSGYVVVRAFITIYVYLYVSLISITNLQMKIVFLFGISFFFLGHLSLAQCLGYNKQIFTEYMIEKS